MLGNQSGKLPLATHGWSFFLFYMLREAKTIYLYLKLDYREEGTGDYLDDNEEWKPLPAGWFYKCLEYKFDDRKDIITNFSSPYNKDAKDFNKPLSAKNKPYILDQLKKHNDEQLTLLYSEINNWQSKSNSSNVSNPRVQKIIHFYETVQDEFQYWYNELGLKFPGKPVTAPIKDLSINKNKKHLFYWKLNLDALQNLYNSLVSYNYINRNKVSFDDFLNLFEGSSIENKGKVETKIITWQGKENEIGYIFGKLAINGVIADNNHWISIEKNFVNKKGKGLKNKILCSTFYSERLPRDHKKIDLIIPSADQKIKK